jgi:GTP-binding protein
MKEPEGAYRVVRAEFDGGGPSAESLPGPTVAEVAFAGRSNVGKSSLMNALMQRKSLVRTSSTPGCTRQINVFSAVMHDGLALRLVDLPGYGYAKLSRSETGTWGKMIEGYLRARAALRAVVLLVDARRGLEADDAQLLEFLRTARKGAPIPAVVVATKIDKLSRAQQKPALDALRKASGAPSTTALIPFSAVTGEGRAQVWEWLRRLVA